MILYRRGENQPKEIGSTTYMYICPLAVVKMAEIAKLEILSVVRTNYIWEVYAKGSESEIEDYEVIERENFKQLEDIIGDNDVFRVGTEYSTITTEQED